MNHLRPPNDRIASAVSEAGNGGSLYGLLDRDEHLRTRATLANALLILELDPDVAGLCAYDEFAERFVLTGGEQIPAHLLQGQDGPPDRRSSFITTPSNVCSLA